MIRYNLPESVTVDGLEYPIRSDYRAVLDIITALNDPELTDADKVAVLLGVFYPGEVPEDTNEAIRQCFEFIAAGQPEKEKPGPRLVDWEKDFPWIISPINRMLGRDVRGMQMHWWTFLSLYYEIGDCTFSKIVQIRDAQAHGRKLEKADREWARRNADLIRIDQKLTEAETELLNTWMKGGTDGA